jgi:putative flippase GtrA
MFPHSTNETPHTTSICMHIQLLSTFLSIYTSIMKYYLYNNLVTFKDKVRSVTNIITNNIIKNITSNITNNIQSVIFLLFLKESKFLYFFINLNIKNFSDFNKFS